MDETLWAVAGNLAVSTDTGVHCVEMVMSSDSRLGLDRKGTVAGLWPAHGDDPGADNVRAESIQDFGKSY